MNTLFVNWNVNPEIFSIGAISVRWYGVMFAVGFLIGYNMVERMLKNDGENIKLMDTLFTYILVATIIGARLGHVFFYAWDYYKEHPGEILKIWHGGLASHGGTLGIFIALLFWSKKISKRPIFWILDKVVVPTALVAAMIRFGNLMNSEIYGIQTNLPWGFIFERNGEIVPKHPTQIYEAICYLIIFVLLYYLYFNTNKSLKRGFITGLFGVLVFSSRFLIEFIKNPQSEFEYSMTLNMGQWLSVPFIVYGVLLIYHSQKASN